MVQSTVKEKLFGREWKSFVVLLLLLIGGRIYLTITTQYTSDDAFITYRYAENLARGEGFVFNSGERVQGTSSPLHTLFLAAVAVVFSPSAIPPASFFIALLADCITIVCIWILLVNVCDVVRFFISAFVALYPKVVLIGISGMEASLVVALMLLSLCVLQDKRFYLAFVLFALLLLLRIDTILWIVLCVILYENKKSIPLGAFVLTIILYGSWVVFAQVYFGTWIPHAIVAKNISWQHLFPPFDPLRVLVGYFPFQGLRSVSPGIQSLVVMVFLIPVIVEVIRLTRMRHPHRIFPLFFLSYNAAFSFGRVWMADWYYLPGYISYFLVFGTFFDWVLKERQEMFSRIFVKIPLQTLVCAVLGTLLVVGALRWKENLGGLFLRQNIALGKWLKSNVPSSARVLIEPIGGVGWESDLYIYDYIGIVSPQVVEYRERFSNSDAWYMAFLQENKPEYLVFRNWEVPSNALFHGHGDGLFRDDSDRAWFNAHYQLVEWNPSAALYDSVYLVLYEKVGRHYEGNLVQATAVNIE